MLKRQVTMAAVLAVGGLLGWLAASARMGEAFAQDPKPQSTPPKMKMTTDIPPAITTPDMVETRLGTLKFTDGMPDKATVEKLYDNLDFMRGVDVFLNTARAASTLANINGLKSVGCNNQTVVLHEERVDARTLLLTPNTQTATLWAYMDLKDGPLVVEMPPGVLGLADDAWMQYVTDIGLIGPDKGKGGKYLFLPPGYKETFPKATLSSNRSPITCGMSCADSGTRAIRNRRSRRSRNSSGLTRWPRPPTRPRPGSLTAPGYISTRSTPATTPTMRK